MAQGSATPPGFRRRDRWLFALMLLAATGAVWHAGTDGGAVHTGRPWAAAVFYATVAVVAAVAGSYYRRAIRRFRAGGRGGGMPLGVAMFAGGGVWLVGVTTPPPGPQLSWGAAAGVGLASLYLVAAFPSRDEARRILDDRGSR